MCLKSTVTEHDKNTHPIFSQRKALLTGFLTIYKQFNSQAPAVPLLLTPFLTGRPVSVKPVTDALHCSHGRVPLP